MTWGLILQHCLLACLQSYKLPDKLQSTIREVEGTLLRRLYHSVHKAFTLTYQVQLSLQSRSSCGEGGDLDRPQGGAEPDVKAAQEPEGQAHETQSQSTHIE
jgi:hypothetical protein